MENKNSNNPRYLEIETRVTNLINMVEERGIDDLEESIDDYSCLIEKEEFKIAIATGIYENYFPPKRHEFEYQLLLELINTIIASKAASNFASFACGGIIGNLAYDLLKGMFNKIIQGFKNNPKEASKFQLLLGDFEKVDEYFKNNKEGEIGNLEKKLGIDRVKLEAIFKLLGYKTYKIKKKRYWKK